ncbi:unnamed protein product [Prunus armeniaca]
MEVKPMSAAISSIALLKNFDVRDVRSLEEIVVPLDKDKWDRGILVIFLPGRNLRISMYRCVEHGEMSS